MDEWPESEYVFNAKAGFIKADIHDGYDEAALSGIDSLIVDYKDRVGLSNTVFLFGEKYWDKAQAERRKNNLIEGPPKYVPVKQEKIISDKAKNYYINAQTIWEKIIQYMPSSPMASEAYQNAAEACKIIGQNEKAIEYFQTAIDKWPDNRMNSHCMNMIASIYKTLQKTGDLSQTEAESKIKQIYELLAADYPDSAPGLIAKGWLRDYAANAAIQQRNEEARKRFPVTSGSARGSRINNSNEGVEQ